MFVLAVLVCGVGGCFLARRNLRRDRGDRRGALRVAGFIFFGGLLTWVLSAHFVPDPPGEYIGFIGGVGNSLYVGGFMWILYLALEPYVRRLWPEMLISWMRVLSGNLRDSRVARDVLVGSVGGVAMALVLNSVNALPAWFSISRFLQLFHILWFCMVPRACWRLSGGIPVRPRSGLWQ